MLLKELERLGTGERKTSTHPPVVAISRTLSHDGEAELGRGERDGEAELSRERDGRVRQ